MLSDSAFVFVLTGAAAVMMASNRVRFDLVALFVVIALILGDILSAAEALSGFGSSVVIMVAALLVVGEMLARTGVAGAVGNIILERGGGNETRLLVLLMVAAAVLGSAMSSTAIVAIFIPVILRISEDTGIARSRLLLPMSYAALISGMLTLIATPPNLVVSDALVDNGYTGLGFFSFLPIGAAVLVVAILYFLFIGRRLLGSKQGTAEERDRGTSDSMSRLGALYRLKDRVHIMRINRPIARKQDLRSLGQRVRILARRRLTSRFGAHPVAFAPGMDLQVGDEILVIGAPEDIAEAVSLPGFSLKQTIRKETLEWLPAVGLADVLIHPEAGEIGKSVIEGEFRTHHHLDVLGILRSGEPLDDPFNQKLRVGDRLLVAGAWDEIDALVEQNQEYVLLGMPGERRQVAPAGARFGVSLAILAGMILLSVFEIVPVVVAVLLAAIAAVLFRTLSAEQAYRSIHWSSIVLVAGLLPLADALDKTGASQQVVDLLFGALGDTTPHVMMAALFLLTAALGLVLSNTASAVLVAPIAITAAETLGVSPYPLAVTVLIAASAAFSTPVSTPIVTLVVAPGNYRFGDFLRVGVPLTILTGVITVLVTPMVFAL